MPTVNISIRYRPVRIGFLVRDGRLEDLVTAAGINTLLWGGIYNPIIPVSATGSSFAEQLIKLFSVDVLYAVSNTQEIESVIQSYPLLKDPSHYAENILYQDWHSKRQILGYLDSINIVDYHWNKEFKATQDDFKSNCAVLRWDQEDARAVLFSMAYGFFPGSYDLKLDHGRAFLKGMRCHEIQLPRNGPVDPTLHSRVTPIVATGSELLKTSRAWSGDGLYVGHEDDFTDLLYFWNLRASGHRVEFVPESFSSQHSDDVRAFLTSLDDIPNKSPHVEDFVTVYHRSDHSAVDKMVNPLRGRKRFVFSNCDSVIWNGLSVKPAAVAFDHKQAVGHVDKSFGSYNITVPLPEKTFLSDYRGRDSDIGYQQLVVSIHSTAEFAHPRHTLNPPYLPELNEFYGREMVFNPWEVRSEREGVGVIIGVHDDTLHLRPISHNKLIERVLSLANLKTTSSQPGLLAQCILDGMGENDLDSSRVFKITGVRRLIKSLRPNDLIDRESAVQVIGKADFGRFKNLYIEARNGGDLTARDAFQYLLKKRVFSPKLKLWHSLLRTKRLFRCKHCGLESTIVVSRFEGIWNCPYCQHQHYLPEYIGDTFTDECDRFWRFKRSHFFAKDNNQDGAIPVILTLMALLRGLRDRDLVYSTSFHVQNESKHEVDFCILDSCSDGRVQIGIGECKSDWSKIDQNDVDVLTRLQEEIDGTGMECFIIFSKTCDTYEKEELALFKQLKARDRRFIVFSNSELESYHPYFDNKRFDQLPDKYDSTLSGMHRNSIFLYADTV